MNDQTMNAVLYHIDQVRNGLDHIDDQINVLRLICHLEQSMFDGQEHATKQPSVLATDELDDDECIDDALISYQSNCSDARRQNFPKAS